MVINAFDFILGMMIDINDRGFTGTANLLDQCQHQLTIDVIKAKARLVQD